MTQQNEQLNDIWQMSFNTTTFIGYTPASKYRHSHRRDSQYLYSVTCRLVDSQISLSIVVYDKNVQTDCLLDVKL